MKGLVRLGAEVVDHLESCGPQLDIERGVRRLRHAPRRSSLRRPLWIAAALAPLLALLVWIVRAEPAGTVSLTYDVAQGTLRFSDGTVVELGRDATAQVERVDEHGADIALTHGSLTASVQSREGARWRVSAGPYIVRVTGTKFTVRWDETTRRFSLSMHEGSVVLSGPELGDARSVHAPEEVIVKMGTDDVRASPDASVSDPELDPAPPRMAASSTVAPPVPSAGTEREVANDSASVLLDRAQAARLSGNAVEAIRALTSLRARFPDSVEAQTAAFLAGKLHFDGGRDDAAIANLRVYVATGGPFIGEAQVMLIVALHRSGREAEARSRARAFIDADPQSAHARRLRSLLE